MVESAAALRAPDPVWPADIDAFSEEVSALGARLKDEMGPEDLAHFRKISRWGLACTALGYGLAWLAPNPVSIALIALGRLSRWTMIGHHVGHRGYDRVGGPTGRDFAEGARRWEWLDWLLPAAWKHEHNLHHFRLNESRDPDLVEENLAWLRDGDRPLWQRYLVVAFFVLTWRWSYYAPNTLAELSRKNLGDDEVDTRSIYTFDPRTPLGRTLWLRSLLPYGGVAFVLLPLLFLPLGLWAAFSVLVNSLLAEAVVNVHSFLVVVPNHCGGDLYRFDTPAKGRGEYYFRQVVGSANYRTGGDVNDFLHGFLNYQIEHHLWPELSMRAYQKAQPEVVELCRKHGLPYLQESVFTRAWRAIQVMVGNESMLRLERR